MADEPMTLPVSPKPPDDPSGHHDIVKNPVSRRFWSFRNIVALVLTALIPVGASKTMDMVSFFQTMDERLESLEADKSSSEAIWKAISDIRHDEVEARIKYEAAMMLFDREFRDRFPAYRAPEAKKPDPNEIPELLVPTIPPEPKPGPKVDPPPVVVPKAGFYMDPNNRKKVMEQFGLTEAELDAFLKSPDSYKQFRESYEKRFPGAQQKK